MPLVVSAAATASAAFLWCAIIGCTTIATEFRNGKRHATEKCARILALAAWRALLVGNAIIGTLNEKLRGALEPYYREYSEGNVESRAVCDYTRFASETAFYLLGELATLAGVARAITITYPCAENDGLYRFYHCDRIAIAYGIEISDVTEGVFRAGGEGYRASLSAVKYNIFFQCGYTGK